MPRTKKATPAKPNAIIASAARVQGRSALRSTPQNQGNSEPWQTEAWSMLDSVGELEFYRIWKSNLMSRVTLTLVEYVPGEDGTLGPVPINLQGAELDEDQQRAVDAHNALFSGDAGQSQMMAALGGLLSVPGEAWLFGIVEPDLTDPDAPDQWRVLSQEEVRAVGDHWEVDRGDSRVEKYAMGDEEAGTDPEAIAIRIWAPHPRKAAYATTSVRSALPILRELRGLEQRTSADIDSRLMGNGLLVVPAEATFTTPNDKDDPDDPSTDPLMAGIIDIAITAIKDRNSPAAVAPGIIRAPANTIEHIKHITLSTPFDEKTLDLKNADLLRLSTSLDCPGDVLTGMTDVNHWSAWLLDDNNIKAHVEPQAELIVNALRTRYLWPALQGEAPTFDPALRRFGYLADTSALRARVDKSPSAQYLYDAKVITGAALARELGGFGGEDLLDPTSDEWQRRWLETAASGSVPPETTVKALQLLGVPVPDAPDAAAPAAVPAPPAPPELPPSNGVPDTKPGDGGGTEPAAPPAAAAATLLVASDLVCQRALERARNRVAKRSRSGVLRPVPAEQLSTCLAGAWEQVPWVAQVSGVDEEKLTAALEAYCSAVLTQGVAHDRRTLGRVLRGKGLIGG